MKLFPIIVMSVIWFTLSACTFDKEIEQLRIGLVAWPGYDVILYGVEKGLFKQQGIDLELVRFQNDSDACRAAMRGNLDAAFTPLWNILQVDVESDHPVILAAVNISYGSDGIVAQSEIHHFRDLQGKTIAAKLGTISHLILLEALRLHNMPLTSVIIEDISNEAGMQEIIDRQVDAAVMWEPLLSETRQKTQGNIVYTTRDVDSLVLDGLVARANTVAEKQDTFVRFLTVWFDVMDAVEKRPEEVYASVGRQLGQTTEEFKRDYQGLKKGDIAMNQLMFSKRFKEVIPQYLSLLKEDQRHKKALRDDLLIDAGPITQAIQRWQSANP